MTTAIIQPGSSSKNGAVVRYSGLGAAMAAADTIGITTLTDVFLHTVPAGGQSLSEALLALAILIGADGQHSATVSENQADDMCLRVDGVGYLNNASVSTPVFVVA